MKNGSPSELNLHAEEQAQTAAEENERRHRTTLDNILEGCQLIGFDWRYIYLNEAASVQNKRPNAELIGKTMQECWPGIEFTDSFALLQRSMEERISLSREVEFEFPDGSVGWFELRGHPVPEGLFILSVDVTERHLALQKLEDKTVELEAANRALREEAEARERMATRLETLVSEASIGILVHQDFKPIMANGELARIFGYEDKEDILRMDDCRGLFADDEQDRIEGYSKARLTGGGPPGFYSLKGKKKDGAIVQLENRAFPIVWGGGRLSICAMLTDVTEQRKLEAQLRQSQRLEAIGQMTGGLAHDFNNLLTVILGNGELLEESLADNPDLRELAEMTVKAAERGAELSSRLLAFSRQQALDPKVVDVNDLVAGMDGLLRRAVGEQVEVRTAYGEGLWRALIDAPQLESALLNLCVNARDAMPDGGQLIIETDNVHLDASDIGEQSGVDPGEYVRIAVSDTGMGMDEATRLRAFDPFFTTKDVGKGSGLGLSMVYGFVKQSKGHVSIYSEPGIGSTIKLYLPRADKQADSFELRGEPDAASGGAEKILVVEDDELVRNQVANQLKKIGYEVVSASDGVEALELLKQTDDFDLLFTDVIMPRGMNGRRLAEEARALYPDLAVLFTSGYTENAMADRDGRIPGVQLLSKPYRRQDLAAKVRAALDFARR